MVGEGIEHRVYGAGTVGVLLYRPVEDLFQGWVPALRARPGRPNCGRQRASAARPVGRRHHQRQAQAARGLNAEAADELDVLHLFAGGDIDGKRPDGHRHLPRLAQHPAAGDPDRVLPMDLAHLQLGQAHLHGRALRRRRHGDGVLGPSLRRGLGRAHLAVLGMSVQVGLVGPQLVALPVVVHGPETALEIVQRLADRLVRPPIGHQVDKRDGVDVPVR